MPEKARYKCDKLIGPTPPRPTSPAKPGAASCMCVSRHCGQTPVPRTESRQAHAASCMCVSRHCGSSGPGHRRDTRPSANSSSASPASPGPSRCPGGGSCGRDTSYRTLAHTYLALKKLTGHDTSDIGYYSGVIQVCRCRPEIREDCHRFIRTRAVDLSPWKARWGVVSAFVGYSLLQSSLPSAVLDRVEIDREED